jgi:hypothetical protein
MLLLAFFFCLVRGIKRLKNMIRFQVNFFFNLISRYR